MHPLTFKDNSKGHIRTKYTGMTCNGVGVILPRRWWTLGSCTCVVGLSISFWLYCLLKSLWFEQLQWCFYVICLYFAWDERHFFIALMQEVEKNGALLSKRQTSFNVKYFWEYLHTPMDEQWDNVSSICKEQDGMPDDVEKNRICRIKECVRKCTV